MAPKIVRIADRGGVLGLSVALGVACTLAGFIVVNRVVHLPQHTDETAVGPREDLESDAGVGAQPPTTSNATNVHAAAETDPVVAVRVTRVDVQACGDGDELDTLGDRCASSAAVETILRRALNRLGDCPSALIAGQNPAEVLSLGLKVDFARRRVTAVQGRASSVREPLTFVACARTGLGSLEDLWEQPHIKNRYLYIFAMRFGPLTQQAQRLLDAGVAPVQSQTPVPSQTLGGSTIDAGRADSRPILRGPCPVTPGTAADPCPGYRVIAPVNTPDDPTLSQPVNVYMGGVAVAHPESATVTWSRALIRAEPRTGAVITRIPYNTRVSIEARSGSWYRVRWASGFGWVFGDAIGKGSPDGGAGTP